MSRLTIMLIFESIIFAQPGLFFSHNPHKIPLMRKKLLRKLSLGMLSSAYVLSSLGAAMTTGSTPAAQSDKNVWQALGKKMSLTSYQNNPQVQQKIRWYLAHQAVLNEFNHNAKPYINYVSEQVDKNHMPMELAFLPMIESSYLPNERSSAKACGLWQLEPQTARDLGVSVTRFYDGRKDVVSSTHAALTYLDYLHSYFHNWPLALAAYNAGMGTVLKAIAFNKAHHRSTDYWSLPLPKETRDYVPKLLAVATIFGNPSAYKVTGISTGVATTVTTNTNSLKTLANTNMRNLIHPSESNESFNLALTNTGVDEIS